RRNHLERARHLAGVLHALDLGLDFPAASHVLLARCARLAWSGMPVRVRPGPGPGPRRLPASAGHVHRSPSAAAQNEPVCLTSVISVLNAASTSLSHLPVATMSPISAPWVLAMWACRPASKAPMRFIGTSSM